MNVILIYLILGQAEKIKNYQDFINQNLDDFKLEDDIYLPVYRDIAIKHFEDNLGDNININSDPIKEIISKSGHKINLPEIDKLLTVISIIKNQLSIEKKKLEQYKNYQVSDDYDLGVDNNIDIKKISHIFKWGLMKLGINSSSSTKQVEEIIKLLDLSVIKKMITTLITQIKWL